MLPTVAVLTEKIVNLARHFAMHRKDHHSKRGFQVRERYPSLLIYYQNLFFPFPPSSGAYFKTQRSFEASSEARLRVVCGDGEEFGSAGRGAAAPHQNLITSLQYQIVTISIL